MSQEIKELLEEIKTAAGKTQRDVFYYLKADQALTKLREAPEQPPDSEFTKKWRHLITGGDPNISGELTNISGVTMLEACDIIDRAEASCKELRNEFLEAHKTLLAIKLWASHIKNAPKELYEDIKQIEAAIAKEKEGKEWVIKK